MQRLEWFIEPVSHRSKSLILLKGGVRFVCPLVNSLEWSVKALLDSSATQK